MSGRMVHMVVRTRRAVDGTTGRTRGTVGSVKLSNGRNVRKVGRTSHATRRAVSEVRGIIGSTEAGFSDLQGDKSGTFSGVGRGMKDTIGDVNGVAGMSRVTSVTVSGLGKISSKVGDGFGDSGGSVSSFNSRFSGLGGGVIGFDSATGGDVARTFADTASDTGNGLTKLSGDVSRTETGLGRFDTSTGDTNKKLKFLQDTTSVAMNVVNCSLIGDVTRSTERSVGTTNGFRTFNGEVGVSRSRVSSFDRRYSGLRRDFGGISVGTMNTDTLRVKIGLGLPGRSVRRLAGAATMVDSTFIGRKHARRSTVLTISSTVSNRFEELRRLNVDRSRLGGGN